MEKRFKKNSNHIIKIAITGPESTGKSSISEELAKHFQTVCVPEFARTYIENLGKPYIYEDILTIAKGQIDSETDYLPKANIFLFCDTELLVTKIWSEHAYQKCDDWILNTITKQTYDLYLLMDIDIPWKHDIQREHPHLRKYFFNLYLNELSSRKLPFEIISGENSNRTALAIKVINKYFSHL